MDYFSFIFHELLRASHAPFYLVIYLDPDGFLLAFFILRVTWNPFHSSLRCSLYNSLALVGHAGSLGELLGVPVVPPSSSVFMET